MYFCAEYGAQVHKNFCLQLYREIIIKFSLAVKNQLFLLLTNILKLCELNKLLSAQRNQFCEHQPHVLLCAEYGAQVHKNFCLQLYREIIIKFSLAVKNQ